LKEQRLCQKTPEAEDDANNWRLSTIGRKTSSQIAFENGFGHTGMPDPRTFFAFVVKPIRQRADGRGRKPAGGYGGSGGQKVLSVTGPHP